MCEVVSDKFQLDLNLYTLVQNNNKLNQQKLGFNDLFKIYTDDSG